LFESVARQGKGSIVSLNCNDYSEACKKSTPHRSDSNFWRAIRKFFVVLIDLMFVAVPPSQVIIYDSSGRELGDVVGPLEEGQDLLLKCEVRGGKEPPNF